QAQEQGGRRWRRRRAAPDRRGELRGRRLRHGPRRRGLRRRAGQRRVRQDDQDGARRAGLRHGRQVEEQGGALRGLQAVQDDGRLDPRHPPEEDDDGVRAVHLLLQALPLPLDASSSGADRSKDGRKGWSVAQPLGRKPAPVMSMRTRSVNGLDASPAVAAAGNGPCSGKSEEVPCLFEPSPVAVASASEWGGAKTIVMPDQVVSSGGGDASSDGLLHSSPEDGMPRPLESSFAFARPLGMPAAPPSLGMLPMAPLPPSVPASSPPYSSSPGDPLGPPPPSAGMASLPPLTPAELSAVKEGMDSSDIERGLGDGLRSSPLSDDYLVLSDGLAPHLDVLLSASRRKSSLEGLNGDAATFIHVIFYNTLSICTLWHLQISPVTIRQKAGIAVLQEESLLRKRKIIICHRMPQNAAECRRISTCKSCLSVVRSLQISQGTFIMERLVVT
ncbi:hypothetical protein THAOC_03088, partial [Thalassiosira oceanica]